MHIGLIGPYVKSIRQQQKCGAIIKNYMSLTCMKMIDPATGWFEIVKVPSFNLEEVSKVNIEYINKLYSRVSQMFNKK